MSRFIRILPRMALLLAIAGGCSTKSQHVDVWDNYDVRPGTPSIVPNDAYYSSPDCSIMDSPACGGD